MTAKNTRKQAPAPATTRIDWEAVERDYRAGVLSFAEMGKIHGVSKGRISQVASKRGWEQDLSAKIKLKAEAKVNAATVNAELNAKREVSAAEAVEIGATVLARVKMTHRSDIARSRTLAMRLLEELEAQTVQVPELAKLGELMYAPDKNGTDKLNELYHKIISLPSRTKTMKDLGDTLKTLIGLEREAFSMDADNPGDSGDSAAMGRTFTDAERAVRLARLLAQQESVS